MNRLQDRKARDLALELGALGRQIESGDESRLLVWVIPGELACGHRPLRHHRTYGGSGRNLSPEATPLLFEWADAIRRFGIKSIICLMHDKELSHYNRLQIEVPDLIEFYKKQGFHVRRIPWEDPAHSKSSNTLKKKTKNRICCEALEAFNDLPKPILLHCSAGIDRSSPVAAYLFCHRPHHEQVERGDEKPA